AETRRKTKIESLGFFAHDQILAAERQLPQAVLYGGQANVELFREIKEVFLGRNLQSGASQQAARSAGKKQVGIFIYWRPSHDPLSGRIPGIMLNHREGSAWLEH